MVEISDRTAGSAFIAAAGVKRGARALSQLSAAAGREVELTQTSLRPQASNLGQLGARVADFAGAITSVEEARGIIRSEETTTALKKASQRAVNRILQVESLSNGRTGSATLGANGKASIADMVNSLTSGDSGAGAAIAKVLAKSLSSATGKQPTPLSIIATAATASKKIADIFDRTLPTQVIAQGKAQVEVSRRALEAQAWEIPIVADDPTAVLPAVRVVDAGRPTRSNEGFVVKASTGDKGGTLVLDVSDPNGEDGRLAMADVTGGNGSDVIFLTGANNATIKAGAGNDYVMADGKAVINGGEGDDILIGDVVFGDEGDDHLFGNTLAVGGAGNDRIVMFSLGEDEAPQGLAFGGEGDDIIIGEVSISADGGEGNDAITLRAGGFAGGGVGNDTLTSFTDATMEGGEGDDDMLMLGAGSMDGGAGNDIVTATNYATVAGGKGDDTIRMNAGGVYRFAKGDGNDQVLMGSVLSGKVEDWTKTNRIELTDFARSDVDIYLSANEILIVSRDPAVPDRITMTRPAANDPFEVVFTKDGKTQTANFTGNNEVLGPLLPVLDSTKLG